MNLEAVALAGFIGISVPTIAFIQPEVTPVEKVSEVGEREKTFETANHLVYIYNNDGELFYEAKSKTSDNSLLLRAYPDEDGYRAKYGNTEYFINSDSLEITQNDRQLVSEEVQTVN